MVNNMMIEVPNEVAFAVLKEFEDGFTIEKGVEYLLRESLDMNPMETFGEKDED